MNKWFRVVPTGSDEWFRVVPPAPPIGGRELLKNRLKDGNYSRNYSRGNRDWQW